MRYRDKRFVPDFTASTGQPGLDPPKMVSEYRLLTTVLYCFSTPPPPPRFNLYLPVCSSLSFFFTTVQYSFGINIPLILRLFIVPGPHSHILPFPPSRLKFHGQSLYLCTCTRTLPPFHSVSLHG